MSSGCKPDAAVNAGWTKGTYHSVNTYILAETDVQQKKGMCLALMCKKATFCRENTTAKAIKSLIPVTKVFKQSVKCGPCCTQISENPSM
jgi:hypothetical protein